MQLHRHPTRVSHARCRPIPVALGHPLRAGVLAYSAPILDDTWASMIPSTSTLRPRRSRDIHVTVHSPMASSLGGNSSPGPSFPGGGRPCGQSFSRSLVESRSAKGPTRWSQLSQTLSLLHPVQLADVAPPEARRKVPRVDGALTVAAQGAGRRCAAHAVAMQPAGSGSELPSSSELVSGCCSPGIVAYTGDPTPGTIPVPAGPDARRGSIRQDQIRR